MVSLLPKVDMVLSHSPSLPQFVILLKRLIEHSMCHVTVVCDNLRLLGSITFFQVSVGWQLSNQEMSWFCHLMITLTDRHWSNFCHSLSQVHACCPGSRLGKAVMHALSHGG